MHVTLASKEYVVESEAELRAALENRDARGGAEFWLTYTPPTSGKIPEYPILNLRIHESLAVATYFPDSGHPGFRCYGNQTLDSNRMTTFVFEGSDPSTGEEEPNEFILDVETAIGIASEFLNDSDLPKSRQWLEL